MRKLVVPGAVVQIGEFSFILIGLGASLGLTPLEGTSLVLAGALVSIALNPLVFRAVAPVGKWSRTKPAMARWIAKRRDPLATLPSATEPQFLRKQVVLVGYGRVGRRIGDALRAKSVPFVVAEQNRELVERLRADGGAGVCGDAALSDVLIQAHIADASSARRVRARTRSALNANGRTWRLRSSRAYRLCHGSLEIAHGRADVAEFGRNSARRLGVPIDVGRRALELVCRSSLPDTMRR